MIDNNSFVRKFKGFARGFTYAFPFIILILFVIGNIGSTSGLSIESFRTAYNDIISFLDCGFSSQIEPIYSMLTKILEFFHFDISNLGFFNFTILYMCYFIYVKFLWLLIDVLAWFINLGERLVRKFSGD